MSYSSYLEATATLRTMARRDSEIAQYRLLTHNPVIIIEQILGGVCGTKLRG